MKSGSSLSAVSRNLEEAGLIHNHTVFKYMADFMGMGQKIQSGDYELSRAMSATEILDQLISGDGKPLTTTITIIPGWTVEDVARYLVELKNPRQYGMNSSACANRARVTAGITSSKR